MTESAADRPGMLTRVATWPLEVLVIAYRWLISPLLPPSCRFYPSCSTYALTALRRFGPLVGSWLAVRRLVRCHPWSPGGVDHVPPRDVRGLPDWAAYRADTARREAGWEATAALDVRNDGGKTGASGRPAPPPENRLNPPVRRGMH